MWRDSLDFPARVVDRGSRCERERGRGLHERVRVHGNGWGTRGGDARRMLFRQGLE